LAGAPLPAAVYLENLWLPVRALRGLVADINCQDAYTGSNVSFLNFAYTEVFLHRKINSEPAREILHRPALVENFRASRRGV